MYKTLSQIKMPLDFHFIFFSHPEIYEFLDILDKFRLSGTNTRIRNFMKLKALKEIEPGSQKVNLLDKYNRDSYAALDGSRSQNSDLGDTDQTSVFIHRSQNIFLALHAQIDFNPIDMFQIYDLSRRFILFYFGKLKPGTPKWKLLNHIIRNPSKLDKDTTIRFRDSEADEIKKCPDVWCHIAVLFGNLGVFGSIVKNNLIFCIKIRYFKKYYELIPQGNKYWFCQFIYRKFEGPFGNLRFLFDPNLSESDSESEKNEASLFNSWIKTVQDNEYHWRHHPTPESITTET